MNIKLKYDTFLNLEKACERTSDKELIQYIKELNDIIVYQKNIIKEQRVEIIAQKHKEAWKRYDT